MTGSRSLPSRSLHPCSMHPSTGEGFLLGFMPLPSDALCKGFGCQRSHEPTGFFTITAGAASCRRRGFVLWNRVCHCCDTGDRPAQLSCPTWTLLQGCSLAHFVPASQGPFQLPCCQYPAQQTLCPATVSGWVFILCLTDVGVEWGVPCGCCCRACWCLVRVLEGHELTRDPQNMLHDSLQSFLFLCKTSSLGFRHTSSLIMREWKGF